MAEPQRIAKLLARAGIASRREIERMIEDRRIALNGVALETPATILTSLAGVTVDGTPVAAPEPTRLFRYHKPTGLLTAERDMKGRATIYDRLPPDMPRTVPVGRLDLNTEGLLLMTTDGGLKRRLELPATGLTRSYRARVYGAISQTQLEDLIEGITIDGVRYGAIDANLERRTGTNTWVELTIREGKNREVRRILEHLGVEVNRLIRTRYGPFALGDLPPGAVEEVKQHELVEFLKSLGETPATEIRREPGDGALRKQWRITPKKRAPSPSPLRGEGDTREARRGEGSSGLGRSQRPKIVPGAQSTPNSASAAQKTPVPKYRPDPPKPTRAPRPTAPIREVANAEAAKRPKPKAGWAKAKPKPSRGPRKK